MNVYFEELGLTPGMLNSIRALGYSAPSPIQALAIPHLLAGRDIVGQAQTGTGKTASFAIPLLERLQPDVKGIQALVLCPTRELAIQVAAELVKLAHHQPSLSVVPVYGGQPIERQLRLLAKGAQIVVGTPGRIIDHMGRGTIKLQQLAMAVLDEADEMLNMGFREDIESILQKAPDDCQRALFSATMPPAIMKLAKQFLQDPKVLRVENKELTVESVEQLYYEVRPPQKLDYLCRILSSQNLRKVLVFCSTKNSVDEMTALLQKRGYVADCLHGNLVQAQRDKVMSSFRTGDIKILVATDVAARGLDVNDVDAVINYDIPGDAESYVHRIGRTGRAGKLGRAYTLVSNREIYKLRDIMRHTKATIHLGKIPSIEQMIKLKTESFIQTLLNTAQADGLDRYMKIVRNSLQDSDSERVMAALLKMSLETDIKQLEEQREREGKEVSRAPFGPPSRKGVIEKMLRLHFSVGSRAGVSSRDLVGAIAGETGLPSRVIGAIEIFDSFSLVDVDSRIAGEVMAVMNRKQVRGTKVRVKPDERKSAESPRRGKRMTANPPNGPSKFAAKTLGNMAGKQANSCRP